MAVFDRAQDEAVAAWLRRDLLSRYGDTLLEDVPEELARLLEQPSKLH